MNFKIRVVENIGCYSGICIGPVGAIFNVIDGKFQDIMGYQWSGISITGFNDVAEINDYFEFTDNYATKFELVEEEQDEDR